MIYTKCEECTKIARILTKMALDELKKSNIPSVYMDTDAKIIVSLIPLVESFLEESDTKRYLFRSSIGILEHELKLAKEQNPNELEDWFNKFKVKREMNKAKILKENSEKETREFEMFQRWSQNRSIDDIKKELGKFEQQFEKLSHKEARIPIGIHTQRKYRLQNQVNGLVKLINMIEFGLKKLESKDAKESFDST